MAGPQLPRRIVKVGACLLVVKSNLRASSKTFYRRPVCLSAWCTMQETQRLISEPGGYSTFSGVTCM